MTSTRQRDGCIPKMHLCAATVALALAFVLVLAVATPPSAQAQTYSEKVLYSFTGAPDGANPGFGSLALSPSGKLFGTTETGGTSTYCGSGCGTIFAVNWKGTETVVYSFTGAPDGATPFGTVIRDAKGTLYGTTMSGGVNTMGTVYKLDKSGTETVLYSFPGFSGDGENPWGVVPVKDKQGNLYGTTVGGGTSGFGTVFKVSSDGIETVLHNFTGTPDGEYPRTGLLLDAKGNLYGTTLNGGTAGQGTVYKLDTTGTESVLYSFTGAPDGANPYGNVVRDARGNLYGTTSGGGTGGFGTVFKLSTKGKEIVLYKFTGTPDGAWPVSGVLRDAKGNLFGTTSGGGAGGFGTVFKVTSKGKETVLHSFTGTPDGAGPYGNVVQNAKGTLYGTATTGGTYNYGVVWQMRK